MMMVMKAGKPSVKSLKSMFITSIIMSAPTMSSAGAVAKGGTRPMSGANTSDTAKRMAAVSAVRPVRPPCEMPAALST